MTGRNDGIGRYASSPCMAGEEAPDYFDLLGVDPGKVHGFGCERTITKGDINMALKHAEPGEVVDLRPHGSRIGAAKTSAIVRTPGFEAIRLVVPNGSEISSHHVAGQIMFLCIEGHAQLGLTDKTIDLRAGDWVYLEGGKPHSVKGIEDASLLMTILF
ncbi:cupin domain-containing protein [Hyphomonas sp. BRH_c22]|uniref:cupin domain-containing protein n=1 Tax=Hyphomonas sp. BRH_c22 TaxID=1629710 RepID=UPI000AD257B1|nr:cupin domain-containing protein [Hyphomonas sp. BRH_c22]